VQRSHATPVRRTSGRLALILAVAALLAVAFSGDVLGRTTPAAPSEVVVAVHGDVADVAARVETTIPGAQVRWRYNLVFHGLAVLLPPSRVDALLEIPGVGAEWPNVTYHSAAARLGPQQIGADKLWGAALESSGQGMKIGIVDDGVDASNPYLGSSGFQYPPGFPKGQTRFATPKVIVQRAFPPPAPKYANAGLPFDPAESFHATHVAGIAAGDHDTLAQGQRISGVAPSAQIGNYKALTIPTPGFGLDGNAAEIAAAIEAAVADGMNVINLSLGEPEVEPSRDLVVKAIEGAAAAGVVPVIAAGNDFDDFGFGSISSPANAPSAIAVAAVDAQNRMADFSSAGPTAISLRMKPDVSAPGVGILSSLPASEGTFGLLSGTSMAAPHVSGAAALLKERHPAWTVAQIKSALAQTGAPAHPEAGPASVEDQPTREGGGVVDLPRADTPFLFADPTGLSFGRLAPGQAASRTVSLSDAGGGAGAWTVTAPGLTAPATVTVPGDLVVTATGAAAPGDSSSFIVLTRGSDTRRIPWWFQTSAPKLAGEKKTTLARPGTYKGTTRGGPALVSRYRYPTGGDRAYNGPESAYRVSIPAGAANAGVVVLTGTAYPHVTFDGAEDRLAGYTALPLDLNPYRRSYGATRRVAGVVLPGRGPYDIVFDTTSPAAAGPFTFRYWVNDTRPPTLRVSSSKGALVVHATDAGAGVDPESIVARLDGKTVAARYSPSAHTITIAARKGRHTLALSVADYQETKNMEDVAKILPNTAELRRVLRVR
jgi:subtilisin family serine protease